MRTLVCVVLVLVPCALGQDSSDRAAVLAQARRDLQAQLEVADMLLERGDANAAELA